MDREGQGIDWEALDAYFVEHTAPDMTLRDFADNVTVSLPETNYTALHYEVIKDRAKQNFWLRHRAQYLLKQNPGLLQDTRVFYGIIKTRIVDEADTLSILDLNRLIASVGNLQEILRAHEVASASSTTSEERLTRDDIIAIMREEVEVNPRRLFELACDQMHEENPSIEDLPEEGDAE